MYSIVEPDPVAQEQIAALPGDALRYLAGVLDLIEVEPWAGGSKPDGNMRVMPFENVGS
ncbi:hypothetical protein Psi02_42510 [Planotetraspora silvatica]|uniref:Uncharacterized protein n=1 Tax=Planotetraspora silvatica TaxID=234614 RepID=A0A8J3XMU3_9ACTN|nr:hypothetical protein [Planotetraspora silvatica]GII47827.1 hypothetical protein Psi02_42510 [Planotetraspora silvatica]